MIGAHPLLQIHRVVKELRLALLLSHHDGNTALSHRHAFGTIFFRENAIWATRPLDEPLGVMFLMDGLNFNQGNGEATLEDLDVATISHAEIFRAPMHLNTVR